MIIELAQVKGANALKINGLYKQQGEEQNGKKLFKRLADGAAGDLAFFGLTEYYHESMCLYQWVFRGTRVVSGLAGTDMAAACDCVSVGFGVMPSRR